MFLFVSLAQALNTKQSVLEKSHALRHGADLLDSLRYDLAHSAMPVSAASLKGLQLLQRSAEFSAIFDEPRPHHELRKRRGNGRGFRAAIFTTQQNLSSHDPATVQTLAAHLREAAIDATMEDAIAPRNLASVTARGGAALQANVGRRAEKLRSASNIADVPANFWTEVNPADMPGTWGDEKPLHVPVASTTEEPAKPASTASKTTEEHPTVNLISGEEKHNSVKSVTEKKAPVRSIHSVGIIILVVLVVTCVSIFIYFHKKNRKQCDNNKFMGPYPPAKIAARNLTEEKTDDETVQFAPSRRMANRKST